MLEQRKEVLHKSTTRNLVDDDIYLNEDRYKKPKEMFKFIGSLVEKNVTTEPLEILDVGCATGEFIYYLRSKFQSSRCTGIDVSENMVQLAQNKMPTEKWLCEDILTIPYVSKKQFDIVLCVGVLQIFDDIETPIKNLMSCVKQEGSLYIAGIFNIHPVDVITRYKTPRQENLGWQQGWNMFSIQTYETILTKLNVTHWKWHDFKMPFHINETEDPMRTWTEATEKNAFQLVNGASQLVNIKVLEIKK